jgi:riboflavin synthase
VFTGLVRAVGKLTNVTRTATGADLTVDLGGLASGAAIGDSFAISGVCLTVTSLSGDVAKFDAVNETLRITKLGDLSAPCDVNLEPALRAGDAFGGHFVSGHVDGTATLVAVEPTGDGSELTFTADEPLLADVVPKGSIAIDGVSLTISRLERGSFRIAVIPHTLASTTLGSLRAGARVNIETDMLVKAVRRVLTGGTGERGKLTVDFLKEHGFA